jgi:hypothetical protein
LLLLLLMVQSTSLALVELSPAISQLLDAEALVVRVVAGEVAVCFQPKGVVAAGEKEFLEITHIDWSLNCLIAVVGSGRW